MRIAKVIRRRIHKHGNAVDFTGDVNAAIAGNVGERPSAATRVSSKQTVQHTTQGTKKEA